MEFHRHDDYPVGFPLAVPAQTALDRGYCWSRAPNQLPDEYRRRQIKVAKKGAGHVRSSVAPYEPEAAQTRVRALHCRDERRDLHEVGRAPTTFMI